MASFSFGAGNAAKLLRIPWYLAGSLATRLIPRTRDEWVFGCAVGIADGALALWERAREAGEKAIWLTGDERQDAAAAAAGIPTVHRDSLRGFWRTARARVVVVTHGFGDVNRYGASGALVVQLWHGIPLKRIGLDSPATTRSPVPGLEPLIAALYRRTQRQIGLVPAASHLVRGRLQSAFALPDDRVPVTGEPRVDVLSTGGADGAAARRARARARLSDLAGPLGADRVVLYAPTWRDGAVDPAVPTAEDWRAIEALLADQAAVLFVRSHPLGAGDYGGGGGGRVRMLGADVVADVTPLLPAVDVLVTDYSSLVFDAALVPAPTVFLAPDAERYAVERGFYGTYDDVTAGEVARTWTDAVERIRGVLAEPQERDRLLARARALDAAVHAHRDGGNTDRVYRAIRARLDAGRR